ncbi:hypothetical protein [Aliarcobacter cryaerophilus]|uniref:hypothetical protein n=1 Tax=Aliarcobacter cryaerophilus TaxID=28198 RepID=UPI003BB07CC9
MANTTQENILIYMQNGNAISPVIAAHEFSCYCLASVIKKLRDKGIEILAREIPDTRTKEYYMELTNEQ